MCNLWYCKLVQGLHIILNFCRYTYSKRVTDLVKHRLTILLIVSLYKYQTNKNIRSKSKWAIQYVTTSIAKAKPPFRIGKYFVLFTYLMTTSGLSTEPRTLLIIEPEKQWSTADTIIFHISATISNGKQLTNMLESSYGKPRTTPSQIGCRQSSKQWLLASEGLNSKIIKWMCVNDI